MTSLADYLHTRRTVPSVALDEPGPDSETLKSMLTIAMRVPDHGKLAPWRFIVYSRAADGERIGDKLAEIWKRRDPEAVEKRLEQERTRFTRAPLVVAVVSTADLHPKIPVWEQELSAGAVCMNLLHAAAAYGFSAQWLTEWFAFDEEAASYLGLDEGERFAGFVQIGTPTEPPVERPRPEVADKLSTWGGKG